MEFEEVNLLNVAEGAAVERFDFELNKVIDDIRDLNKDPTKTREVILKVKMSADSDRKNISVSVVATSKLAQDNPAIGLVYLGQKNAVVPPMQQMSFENLNEERDEVTALIDKEKVK